MDTREIFVAAARKCLSAGRKSVSVPQSLDIAAQLSAVDFALKPSLLYDTNSASVEQVHQYLRLCQSSQLVSESLVTLDLNEKPTIADPVTGRLKSIAQDLLFLLGGFDAADDKGVYVAERSDEWNLSAVFGLLLGYPITYWFNQTESFDNCLSMTPLMVTTAHATWQAGSTRDKCCLYSFSIPAVLQNETQSYLEDWKLGLQERFQQQNVLKDLDVCQSAVTLPSVCL
ncbi:UPF0739 protein C1orf74 homolog isoform X2 [Dunckerocampus dactyliophorus]|uniref:UPF0739 protein C1orf74 homolog isoform X2 n=1 Tax=Dunckerocampus dactyliophorus TaxID=161453 RepID=UPI002406624D|nr:UPF0739 protein C1orf74 homolog isoform X2 [Dunckerocampus dactyliophorus]